MIDLKFIREKPEEVEKALARRNGGFTATTLVQADADHRRIQGEWESLNRRTNEISELFKTGKVPKEDMDALKQETKDIKKRREEIESEKQELESRMQALHLALPNMPDPSVP